MRPEERLGGQPEVQRAGGGYFEPVVIDSDANRASADGTSFTKQKWSTPLTAFRESGGHRLPTVGEGRWYAPAPEGTFTYLEFHLDDIHYNVQSAR